MNADHRTKGVLQKAPPTAPIMVIIGISDKAPVPPKKEPKTGNTKVKNATGIRCFKLGLQHPHLSAKCRTEKADASGMPITISHAGHTQCMRLLRQVETVGNKNPTKAPVAMPVKNKSLFFTLFV